MKSKTGFFIAAVTEQYQFPKTQKGTNKPIQATNYVKIMRCGLVLDKNENRFNIVTRKY